MAATRKFIVALGLKGDCPVGLLDNNHILLRPMLEIDYTGLFIRRTWFVHNSPMQLSKWTMDFKANHESSIVPIWVCFPELPLLLFNMKYLHKIASLLGHPLRVDTATLELRRPSMVRVLVEIDVAKASAQRLWIGEEAMGM